MKGEHLSGLREWENMGVGRGISGRRNVLGEDGVGHIESGRTFGRGGGERGKGGGGEPYRAEGMFGERMA